MPSKSAYGTYTPRQRSDGRWYCQVPTTAPDGSRRLRYITAATERECRTKRDQAVAKEQAGVSTPDRLTVADYLTDWLKAIALNRRVRTVEGYSQIVRDHLIPGLGRQRLARLTSRDVQALLVRKLAESNGRGGTLSAARVRRIHACLRAALAKAVKARLLQSNPADAAFLNLPREERAEIEPLSASEALAFLAACRGHRLEALFVTALCTGLRQGELFGLRWQDVDLEGGTIRVRQAIDQWGRTDVPKSKRSRRGVPLVPDALAALRAHRERQKAAGRITDLVFTTTAGTRLRPNNLVRRDYQPLLRQAGIARHVRFHDLRHTTGTLLLEIGVHPRVVADILGHARTDTTLEIYSHVSGDLARREIGRLGDLLRPR